MNAVLAKNVRTVRDLKHWTQQHLADAAGILLRTVQRVEKGDGASVETLGALANAFDLSIDVLQTDFVSMSEQIEREREALARTHYLVPMTPGYHSNVGGIYYAVMPYPLCAGCLGGMNALDALTGTSSHELCEAITDPRTGLRLIRRPQRRDR